MRINNYSAMEDSLYALAKHTYPFPPNPFCPGWVSVETAHKALKRAGYKNFQLHVDTDGIFIEPKERQSA